MKNNITLLVAVFASFQITAQKLVGTIVPSKEELVPCLGIIEPMKLPLDKWNFTVQNETVENWMNPKVQEMIKEKTKLKLEQLGKKEYSEIGTVVTSSITIAKGHNFAGQGNGMTPFDNGTSVSNGKFVIQTINAKIQIFDTSGTSLYSNSLATFLGLSGVFDPRVVYDSYEDRFIVFCADAKWGVQFAFSATNDPTKTWYKYNVKYTGASGSFGFADYPYAGVTEHDLILESITPSAYVIQMAKAEGYKGGTLRTKNYKLASNFDNAAVADHGRSDTPYPKEGYIVGFTSSTTIGLIEFSDTIGGNPVANVFSIPIPAYSVAGSVMQKGSSATLAGSDGRIMNAYYANGIIHCVHNTAYNNGTYGGLAYYRINVATKTATPYYFGLANSDIVNPSVALFGTSLTDKTVVIGYTESNSNIYPSMSAVVCDDGGNWSVPALLKAGVGFISGSRYGDYTSIARKHNANVPTAWFSAEYGGPGNTRASWIAEIKRTDAGINVSVPEVKAQESYYVYPNPIIDRFTFSIDLEKTHPDVNISIYNMEGKMVKELFKGSLREGENEMSFDKAALKTGVYFIKIQSPKALLKSEKVIIAD